MPPMKFDWLPMFRGFVPRGVRPWVYVVLAACFQMSGGMYMGAINEVVGSRQLLREDVLMCLYCHLAGMSVYFPLLFRMKFRHTNKSLLFGAAFVLSGCTIGAAYAANLPTLWLLCVVSGFCKIQGTFECMSNIQLWITPRRDFRVFFPVLHIFILGMMQVSDYVAAWVAYTWKWEYMHWLMCGLFMVVCVLLSLLTRRVRFMPVMPLAGVDWLGGVLWLTTLLLTAYFFCYGRVLDWLHSWALRMVGVGAVVSLVLAVVRSFLAEHAYVVPSIWRVRRVVLVFGIVAVGELLLSSERVLEEVFYGSGMGYGKITVAGNDVWCFAGCVLGCVVSLLWMKVWGLNALRLTTLGFWVVGGYLVWFYVSVSSEFEFGVLGGVVMARSFGYAVISVSLMVILHDLMTFETFFMALSVFNMFHMIVGGVVGGALYSYGLDYYVGDFMGRYGEMFDHVAMSRDVLGFGERVGMVGRGVVIMAVKELYGWGAYGCLLVGFVLLCYKVPLFRSTYRRMKSWGRVWCEVSGRLRRESFGENRG